MSYQASFGSSMLCKFARVLNLPLLAHCIFVHVGLLYDANCPWCLCGLCSVESINDDLNASLATADELSREFSSMLNEASSSSNNNNETNSGSQVHTHL